MRMPIVSASLAVLFAVLPAVGDGAPVLAQDFSITNEAAPPNPAHRDLTRQLQAWWDVHAYYPRHASDNDEAGTVKVRLAIRPDGNIWTVEIIGNAGSPSLDAAAAAVFRGGFVRPLPTGASDTIDLSLNYVLAQRRDRPTAESTMPAASRRPFTVTNEPVTSAIVDTMLQRSCTGTVVKQGIRNHPAYGVRNSAEAVFFRKPDGSPWVKFYEGGFGTLAPVVEIGKIVKWSGRVEWIGAGSRSFTEYTLWPDGGNSLNGNIEIVYLDAAKANQLLNRSGTIDLTCTNETVPAVTWSALSVTPIQPPAGDPP